jgi:hypothetical protein
VTEVTESPFGLRAKARYADGREVEAGVGPRARVELERRSKMEFSQAFDAKNGTAREEYVYLITWAALHYAGLEGEADFDEWLKKIVNAELISGQSVDPTRRARKRASSSP